MKLADPGLAGGGAREGLGLVSPGTGSSGSVPQKLKLKMLWMSQKAFYSDVECQFLSHNHLWFSKSIYA